MLLTNFEATFFFFLGEVITPVFVVQFRGQNDFANLSSLVVTLSRWSAGALPSPATAADAAASNKQQIIFWLKKQTLDKLLKNWLATN